ncbi:MAG: sigma-54 dependent transcriptional regulator [Thermodesulfobacteriota bacterium]|nr:sigma-54 dependent transcriptional regulator [Thermodesulfobacteriota bacterium]
MEYTLIGNHPSIQKIRELITMISDTAFNVLIMGETGTGKEVVARLLHRASNRGDRRFIKVNCPALPLTLLESELFGYDKGAFTGADQLKPGKFELASDGVIFLDEIGDMPVVLQAKLLEVLQSGRFSRLGGTRDIQVNSWVIAATNHDLEKDMKDGFFRVDLYYRLNIIKIEIPPLRDRRRDIPLLTSYFVEKHRRDFGIEKPFRLDGDLKKLFDSYSWPGNVRELGNTIAMLMVGYNQEEVRSELLGNMVTDSMPPACEAASDPSDETDPEDREPKESRPPRSLKDLKAEATRYVEKEAIMHALNLTGWNKREAAKMLKISYKALFYKMANVGIRNNRYKSPLAKRP